MPFPKQGSMERPHTCQGRARSRRERPDPINQPINQPSHLSQKIAGRTEIETGKTNHIHTKDLMHSVNNVSGKITNKKSLNPRCSFPSRSSLQTPAQTHETKYVISWEFTEFN